MITRPPEGGHQPGRGRINQLREFWLPTQPVRDPSPLHRVWLYTVYIFRRWLFEDHCGSGAAVLTIDTILSAVPLLGIALVGVGLLDSEDGARLLRQIFEHIVPSTRQARESASNVLRFARNVTVINLGTWGFLVALGIGFMLFATLESAFNNIWRVTRKRGLIVKFTMFYTVFTLGPLVLLYSLQQAFVSGVSSSSWGPILTTALASVFVNLFMPNTKVRWQAAFIGGTLSALLFEGGKELFTWYIQRIAFDTYEGLYGPLAVMPVFVVWSYLSWLVLLLGVEVSFAVQHGNNIRLEGYVNPYVRRRYWVDKAAGRTAARILLAAADSFERRHRGVTREEASARYHLPLDRVNDILHHLEAAGYVLEADRPEEGFIPARPLAQVTVREILALFDGDEASGVRDDELTRIFAHLDQARDNITADLSYADLVAHERARAGEPPGDRTSSGSGEAPAEASAPRETSSFFDPPTLDGESSEAR